MCAALRGYNPCTAKLMHKVPVHPVTRMYSTVRVLVLYCTVLYSAVLSLIQYCGTVIIIYDLTRNLSCSCMPLGLRHITTSVPVSLTVTATLSPQLRLSYLHHICTMLLARYCKLLLRPRPLHLVSTRVEARRLLSEGPSQVPRKQIPSTAQNQVLSAPRRDARTASRAQHGRGRGFYVGLLAIILVTVPGISYFYWEHRKAHMRAKKEEILREIQARYAS